MHIVYIYTYTLCENFSYDTNNFIHTIYLKKKNISLITVSCRSHVVSMQSSLLIGCGIKISFSTSFERETYPILYN